MSHRQSATNAQMTPEREIFLEALEQPSAEARAAFIARATAANPKLKEAVEALLANNLPDRFLEQGAAGKLRESLKANASTLKLEFSPQTASSEKIGDFIGRYRLMEKIGEET